MERSDVSFHFEGKRFIVVGASSGIGNSVAREISDGGGIALAVARNEERLSRLSFLNPDRIITESVDVRDGGRMEEAVDRFVSRYGKVHGSVYTAGMTAPTPLKAFSMETAREIMDVNYWGWIGFMRIVSRRKYSADGSSHVVVSSVAARTGETGVFAYSASKSALNTSVRTFAKEMAGRGCRVNSVSPGFVDSPMTAGYFEERGFSEQTREKHLLGFGSPEDVSGLILYLLSDRSKWVTGTDHVIDGGYLANG